MKMPGLRRVGFLVALFAAILATTLVATFIAGSIWMMVVDGRSVRVFRPEEFLRFLESAADLDGEGILFLVAAVHAGAVVALLAPVVPRPRRAFEGRSLRWSVFGACAIGGLATLFGFFAIAEGALAVVDLSRDPAKGVDELGEVLCRPVPLFGGWLLSGAAWAWMLGRIGLERHPTTVDRLFRLAFVATSIEAVLAVPLYLMLRRRSGCECALASFMGLIGGVAALAGLCGPWAFLFLTRRVRRNWMRDACPRCGYPRRTDARVCSECGQVLASGAPAPAPDAG